MEDDYVVECTNENCQWQGLLSECDTISDEDSCPKCHFIVEPSDLET